MRTVVITCDRCRQPANDPSIARISGAGGLHALAADLCGPCSLALQAWLAAPPPEPAGRDAADCAAELHRALGGSLLLDREPFHP